MREKLFELLCHALWGGKPDGTWQADEFLGILKLAKSQTVFGLVFDLLQDVRIEEMTDKRPLFEAVGLLESIKRQNWVMNREVAWFAAKMAETSMEYVVVKGQMVARLYPKPELRQSGDIDFLVSQRTQKEMGRIFTEVKIPARLPEKEYEFECHGVTYEIHSRLMDFGSKRHQDTWQQMEEAELTMTKGEGLFVEIEGVKVKTLSPTMNAAYLFVHLFFHLIREGVSLRQFCDWAVFLHHHRNSIDRQKLESFLQQLGLQDAYRAFGSVVVDELGLPSEEFPMEITEKDRQWKGKIIEDIFRGGNFGKENHKAMSAIGFKMETLRLAVRNSIRYHRLAPSEMSMMIPKMIKINLKLLKHNNSNESTIFAS